MKRFRAPDVKKAEAALQRAEVLFTLMQVGIGRRTFLRLMSFAAAAGMLRPRAGLAAHSATNIHRATGNTLLGAIGDGLRQVRAPLPPFKTYEGKSRIALGDVPEANGTSLTQALARASRAATQAASSETRPLTRAQLARVLYLTNGDTGRGDGEPYKLRAAPSAGALYAGEIYVFAASVDGLGRGLYYYDVGKHELVRLSDDLDRAALEQAFETMVVPRAFAVVFLTNVFERYERRYVNRGYRYALIDTGHIGENLALACAALDLDELAFPRFSDDRVNALVGVDGKEEAVCAVHVLGVPGPATPAVRQFVEKGFVEQKLVADAEPTVRYHEASKLVPATARPENSRRSERLKGSTLAADRVTGDRVALPSPATLAASDKPLARCIAERRSPAKFARRTISAAELGFICRAAQPKERAGIAELVDVAVVSHRVEGIEPGLYAYVPGEESLAIVQKADFREALPRVCLGQAKAGDAAIGVLMIGRLRRATVSYGPRSYRDLLIEAGRIGQRVYLAAEALGLKARNLAAFLDGDLNDLVGLDGSERAVVHLTMVGHAA